MTRAELGLGKALVLIPASRGPRERPGAARARILPLQGTCGMG